MIHNVFDNLYPLLLSTMLCFEHVLIDPKVHGICSKMPQWVEPMPLLICVNPKVFTGHTPLVIHQVGFDTEIIFI